MTHTNHFNVSRKKVISCEKAPSVPVTDTGDYSQKSEWADNNYGGQPDCGSHIIRLA
jgi:hypothetical protein